jgi:tetratricopeptide (TPR) repeat protein
LYEMVAGAQPYRADTTERLERMIRSRVPAPPAPESCPEALRRILQKALMPDASLRYGSARAFADDLILFRTGGPVRAAEEDLDSTRRTYRRPDDVEMDGTRRTGGGDADETRRSDFRWPDQVIQGRAEPPKPPNPLTKYVARGIAGLLLIGVLWAAYEGITGYLLYKRGQALIHAVQTEAITDPNAIFTEWTELSKGNPSSLLLRAPRKVVKEKLVEAADRVITSYRNSDAVYENGWKSAREHLAHALAMGPDDTIRGKLRLTEGHIARINGTSRQRTAELKESVEKFNEAQRLLPDSPDPALGLARVYVYGLKDIDKADQALQTAEKRGYPLGNREKAQLADGYRDRANRLFYESRKVRDLPQEKDQIARAKADYERALELYESIAPYGNSPTYISDVRASLDSVNFRLGAIEKHGVVDAAAGAIKKLIQIWK